MKLGKDKPGVHELQQLEVTAASAMDPGSQTTFLHWKFVDNITSNNYPTHK